MPLEKDMLIASVFPVGPQWFSCCFSVVFQCVPIMQLTIGLLLGYHWVLASANVVPVPSQCTGGSSGPSVCSNYATELWIVAGRQLVDSINQCGSSVVFQYGLQKSPVVFRCGSVSTKFFQWCSRVPRVTLWYDTVHWVNKCHSSGIQLCFGPTSVYWFRVGGYQPNLRHHLWPLLLTRVNVDTRMDK